jgi:hypothetical protein
VTAIHGHAADDADVGQSRPGEALHERRAKIGRRKRRATAGSISAGFDDEEPTATVADKGAPGDAGDVARRALDGKGIHDTVGVLHACGAPAEQPEAACRVEIPGVSGPVPHTVAGVNLRLVVADSIEVPAKDVFAGDHDLASLAVSKHRAIEIGRRRESLRTSPPIGQDSELHARFRYSGQQPGALPHGLAIVDAEVSSID